MGILRANSVGKSQLIQSANYIPAGSVHFVFHRSVKNHFLVFHSSRSTASSFLVKAVIKRVCKQRSRTHSCTRRQDIFTMLTRSSVLARFRNISFSSLLRLVEIIIKLFGISFSFTLSRPVFLDKMPSLSCRCAKRPQGRLWVWVRPLDIFSRDKFSAKYLR